LFSENEHNHAEKEGIVPFFSRFIVWVALLQSVVWWFNSTNAAFVFQHGLAEFAGYIGHFFLENITVFENKLIYMDSLRFVVVDNKCTALSLIATLWSGIFALRFKWALKLGMAVGTAILIQLENTIRIIHLYHEIKHPINQFEYYHLYVWQGINFLTAVLVFILMYWVANQYNKLQRT